MAHLEWSEPHRLLSPGHPCLGGPPGLSEAGQLYPPLPLALNASSLDPWPGAGREPAHPLMASPLPSPQDCRQAEPRTALPRPGRGGEAWRDLLPCRHGPGCGHQGSGRGAVCRYGLGESLTSPAGAPAQLLSWPGLAWNLTSGTWAPRRDGPRAQATMSLLGPPHGPRDGSLRGIWPDPAPSPRSRQLERAGLGWCSPGPPWGVFRGAQSTEMGVGGEPRLARRHQGGRGRASLRLGPAGSTRWPRAALASMCLPGVLQHDSFESP